MRSSVAGVGILSLPGLNLLVRRSETCFSLRVAVRLGTLTLGSCGLLRPPY